MARKISYEELKKGFTDEEMTELAKIAKKRRLIYFLVCLGLVVIDSVILLAVQSTEIWLWGIIGISAIAAGVFAGLGCWANNIIRFINTRGRKGGGIVSILWGLWCGLFIPLIVIFICNKTCPYKSVLGWN